MIVSDYLTRPGSILLSCIVVVVLWPLLVEGKEDFSECDLICFWSCPSNSIIDYIVTLSTKEFVGISGSDLGHGDTTPSYPELDAPQ